MKSGLPLVLALTAASAFPANDRPSADPIRFRNVAKDAGIHFVLDNYMSEERHMIETMPGGVASLDYNNDGLLDIYFTNGSVTPSMKKRWKPRKMATVGKVAMMAAAERTCHFPACF